MDVRKAVDLAEELKALAGRGVTPSKLVTMPAICELVEADGMSPDSHGTLLRNTLVAAIGRLSGQYELPKISQSVEADQVKEALVILLILSRRAAAWKADRRRLEAIRALKLRVSVGKWRREGVEYQLMLILAEELLLPPQSPATATAA